ncbi:MAG TPA: serine hydrolase domain-containing protein [Candidatus Acidoferrum sp.]
MSTRKAAIAWQAYRVAYHCVVRLHPRVFREQFGGEMLWIFEEAAETHGALRLLGDGMISLLRQWILRPRPSQVVVAEAVSSVLREPGSFAWEHIGVSFSSLPAGRWMQGGLVSLAMLTGVWTGITQVPKRAPLASFAVDADSAFRARGLVPSNSEDRGTDFVQGGGYASGVYAVMKPQDLSERQRRQQQLAVQVAAGAQIIPGATTLAVESQGLVPELPKTPAGEQFSAWLRAFNSGERTRIEEVRKLFKNPPGPNVDGDMAFRRMTGGFDLRKIDESSATRMSGLVQERASDQFARFEVTVDDSAPHLITDWKLDAIPTPAEFAVGRMSEPLAVEAAKTRIDELAKDERFSGAVLVTRNGKPILSEACGLADREKKIPNSLNTKFRIGSMNKMFTAVSVLQLAQAGKIKLSEPFGKYISDYPNKDAASKVSIEQLLTHTGGTGDIFGPEFELHRKDLRNLQDYVNLYGKRALKFAPGSRWEYSNYGFLLLGVVVERVSGKSYYDYVRENVYAPAGMSSTASLAENENVPDRSIGYTSFGGEAVHPNTDTLPYRGTSAGGGYSTVEDLQRFASALMNHKLLDAEYTDLLTTGKVATPRGGKYAFGFFDDGADTGARHFGHGGGAPGMNGDLQIYPQSGYVITVLSNLDPPAASRVSEFIANRLPKN